MGRMRERSRGWQTIRGQRRPQYPFIAGEPPEEFYVAQTVLRRADSVPTIDSNGMPGTCKAVRFNIATPSTPNSLNRTDWGNPELYWTVSKGAAGDGPGTYLTFLRDCIIHVSYLNFRGEGLDCTGCYGPLLDDGTHPGSGGEWQRGAQFGAPTASRRTAGSGSAAPGLLSLCCHQNYGIAGIAGQHCNWVYGVKVDYRLFFAFYDDKPPDLGKDNCKAVITLIRTRPVTSGSFPS